MTNCQWWRRPDTHMNCDISGSRAFNPTLASLSVWQEIATTTITKQAKLTSHKLKQPKCSFLSSMHLCILKSFSLVVTAPSLYGFSPFSPIELTCRINHVRWGQYLFRFNLKLHVKLWVVNFSYQHVELGFNCSDVPFWIVLWCFNGHNNTSVLKGRCIYLL